MRDQAGRPESSVYVCVLFARAKIIYEVVRRFVDVINLMLPSDEKPDQETDHEIHIEMEIAHVGFLIAFFRF